MVQVYNITIPDDPIAKARHKMGRGRAYDPQHKIKEELRVYLKGLMPQIGVLKPLEGAIACEAGFYIAPPKNTSQRRLKELVEKVVYVTKRPDGDNYLKFYFDVLNGILYKDDSQICVWRGFKRQYPTPKTELRFTCL